MTKEQQALDKCIVDKFLAEFGTNEKITSLSMLEIEKHYHPKSHRIAHITFISLSNSRPNVEIPHKYFTDDALLPLIGFRLGFSHEPIGKAEFDKLYMCNFGPKEDEDGIPDVTTEIDNMRNCYEPRSSTCVVGSGDLNQVLYAFKKTQKVLEEYRNRLCVTCKFKRDEDLNGNTMSEEIFCTQRGKCEPRDVGCNRHRKA